MKNTPEKKNLPYITWRVILLIPPIYTFRIVHNLDTRLVSALTEWYCRQLEQETEPMLTWENGGFFITFRKCSGLDVFSVCMLSASLQEDYHFESQHKLVFFTSRKLSSLPILNLILNRLWIVDVIFKFIHITVIMPWSVAWSLLIGHRCCLWKNCVV